MSNVRHITGLAQDARIYVAGHRGLAGSAVWRGLEARGYANLLGAPSAEVDLRDRDFAFAFFRKHRSDVVVVASAKVGGIMANYSYLAVFLIDYLRIQYMVMDAA